MTGGQVSPQTARRVGGASAGWWGLVAALPPIVGSAVLVGLGCALLAGQPALACLPLLIWAGGAVLAVTRPGERLAVRLACGFRRPTAVQAAVLGRVTLRALVAAGAPAGRVDFYVRRGAGLNGYAAGARSVAISSGALEDFAARRHSRVVIEAVLVHELGHLAVPGSRLMPAAAWLACPWRLLAGLLLRAAGAPGVRRLGGPFVLVLGVGVVIAVIQMARTGQWAGAVGLAVVAVCAIGCPILGAAAGRATERAADGFAADRGYGPVLADALTGIGPDPRTRRGWAGLFDDHPDIAGRVLSLDAGAEEGADSASSTVL